MMIVSYICFDTFDTCIILINDQIFYEIISYTILPSLSIGKAKFFNSQQIIYSILPLCNLLQLKFKICIS